MLAASSHREITTIADESPKPISTLLQIASFRRFVSANPISATGPAMAPLALAYAVIEQGGGAGSLGVVLATDTVPTIVFLLAGGAALGVRPRDLRHGERWPPVEPDGLPEEGPVPAAINLPERDSIPVDNIRGTRCVWTCPPAPNPFVGVARGYPSRQRRGRRDVRPEPGRRGVERRERSAVRWDEAWAPLQSMTDPSWAGRGSSGRRICPPACSATPAPNRAPGV